MNTECLDKGLNPGLALALGADVAVSRSLQQQRLVECDGLKTL